MNSVLAVLMGSLLQVGQAKVINAKVHFPVGIRSMATQTAIAPRGVVYKPFRTFTHGVQSHGLPAGNIPSQPSLILSADELIASRFAPMQKLIAQNPVFLRAGASSAHRGGRDLEKLMTQSVNAAGAGDSIGVNGSGGLSDSSNSLERRTDFEKRVGLAKIVLHKIMGEVSSVIVGQTEMIRALTMALVLGEPVLLEGVPGVAKTVTAKAFASAVKGSAKRVQGTVDVLPTDITGSNILQEDPVTGIKKFVFQPGPIFAEVFLVDEINRMIPKTQAALLEAMAERQVTVGEHTYKLPAGFLLIATENPIEQEGTFPLPEAQLDRFAFKVNVPQPQAHELLKIAKLNESPEKRGKAQAVTTMEEIRETRLLSEEIVISDSISTYIVDLALAPVRDAGISSQLQKNSYFYTRAAILLRRAARVHAVLEGRAHVLPSDVRAVAPLVLRHRLRLNYEAAENGQTVEAVIEKMLNSVAVVF